MLGMRLQQPQCNIKLPSSRINSRSTVSFWVPQSMERKSQPCEISSLERPDLQKPRRSTKHTLRKEVRVSRVRPQIKILTTSSTIGYADRSTITEMSTDLRQTLRPEITFRI